MILEYLIVVVVVVVDCEKLHSCIMKIHNAKLRKFSVVTVTISGCVGGIDGW